MHPYDLTITERKLLCLASILAIRPSVIVLDEPTTAQDQMGVRQLGQIVSALLASGKTVVTITHDMDFVAEFFDRTVVMRQGEVILDGPTAQVFSQPDVLMTTYVKPSAIAQLADDIGAPHEVITVPKMVDWVSTRFRRGKMKSRVLATRKRLSQSFRRDRLIQGASMLSLNEREATLETQRQKRLKAAAFLSDRLPGIPKAVVELGTGQNGFANTFEHEKVIPYHEIPPLKHPPLLIMREAVYGNLDGKPVLVMQGRLHIYEGYTLQEVTFPVRVFHELGVPILVESNRGGSVNPLYRVGDRC